MSVDVREAVLTVLREPGEPLHWTVVQDRALRAGLIDPFEVHDVRREVQRALAELGREGVAVRVATGTWALRGPGT
jgi:hypothetical protein